MSNITGKYNTAQHLRQAVAQKKDLMVRRDIPQEWGGGTLYMWPPIDQRHDGQYAVQRREPANITDFWFVEEWGNGNDPFSFSKARRLKEKQDIEAEMPAIVADLTFLREEAPDRETPARVVELLAQMQERLDEMVVDYGYTPYKPDKVYGVFKVRLLRDEDLAMLPEELKLKRAAKHDIIEDSDETGVPDVREESDVTEDTEEDNQPIGQLAVEAAAKAQGEVQLAPTVPQQEHAVEAESE